MITYVVVKGAPGYGFYVVVKESGAVVAGPFTNQLDAENHTDDLRLGRPVRGVQPPGGTGAAPIRLQP